MDTVLVLKSVRVTCLHYVQEVQRTEAHTTGGHTPSYRGDDKYLARPGRKQATATEDFNVHISYL